MAARTIIVISPGQTSTSGRPGSTFSIVKGKSRTRTPAASNTALATAAPDPQTPSSPRALGAGVVESDVQSAIGTDGLFHSSATSHTGAASNTRS
jgi:hypothetical protein